MRYCQQCGRGIPDTASFCTFCGQANSSQTDNKQNTPPQSTTYVNNNYNEYYSNYPYKSRVVALLLCIFFGAFGVHRFYVGKVGTGIIYCFTGGLCGIGWLVDIISIATGSFRDSFGQPLR